MATPINNYPLPTHWYNLLKDDQIQLAQTYMNICAPYVKSPLVDKEALEKIAVLKERVKKRQEELQLINNFIKICIKSKEINSYKNYTELLDGLESLTEKIQQEFTERRFNKGVKALYPQLLKQCLELLTQTYMLREINNIPEHKIKHDLSLILNNPNTQLQATDECDSVHWITILKKIHLLGTAKYLQLEMQALETDIHTALTDYLANTKLNEE